MKARSIILCILAVLLVPGCFQDDTVQPNLDPVADDPSMVGGCEPSELYTISLPIDGNVRLETIDTSTGEGTLVCTLEFPDGGFPGQPLAITPFGLSFDRRGAMYTIVTWLDFNPDNAFSRLGSIDMETGLVTYIGEPYDIHFAGPEMGPGKFMYATGFTVGDPAGGPPLIFGDSYLYRINTRTGEATQVGDTGRTDWMDLDIDRRGRLWATTENQLWIINQRTGAAQFVTDIIGVPQEDIPGVCPEDWPYMEVMTIAFDRHNVLWATAMRGFSNCTELDTPVMRIDVGTGQATVVGYTGFWYNHGGDIFMR